MSTREPLLSAAFLERLRALRGLLFRRPRRGEWRGAGFGAAPEYDSDRPYEPGDDPRTIDWQIYARLERLWVKLYLIDQESHVGILVDTSRSMRTPEKKLLLAARFAAAFSWLVLSAGRNLRVGAYAEGLLRAHGPYRSLRQFPEVLQLLGSLPHGERTSLGRGLEGFLPAGRKRGLLVVLSDFFQEGDVFEALERARLRGSDLRLVQVVDNAELDPELRGDCRILDLEERARFDLVAGDDLQREVRQSIRAYLDGLAATARARGVSYLLARTAQDFETLFFEHILARRLPEGTRP